MKPSVKIRGIYTTALTLFFLEKDLEVVEPSEAIRNRFADRNWPDCPGMPDVEITGTDDDNGVVLGSEDVPSLHLVSDLIRKAFFDSVCFKESENRLRIEIPYEAKSKMDELRHRVIPTLIGHHRLKIICPEGVDDQEALLHRSPGNREPLSSSLQQRLIWETYYRGKSVAIDHVKTNGRLFSLTPGRILESNAEEKTLLIERGGFSAGGLYDGLDLPKMAGDYALTRIREGDWFCPHVYYRKGGEWIGTYYNVNTGIECFPRKIRYADLEIDVVQRPGEPFEIIDRSALEEAFMRGSITQALRARAESIAMRIQGRGTE